MRFASPKNTLYIYIRRKEPVMTHIELIRKGSLQEVEDRNCRECQASCQSACKTSCTVGNQPCRKKEKTDR